MRLDKFIAWYIEENNISNRELARRCDLSPQTITNIINNETKSGKPIRIDMETTAKIANGTGYGSKAHFYVINGVTYIAVPGIVGEEREAPSVEFQQEEDPDIRMIARAGHKMDPEKRAEMIRVLKALYPEEFGDNK